MRLESIRTLRNPATFRLLFVILTGSRVPALLFGQCGSDRISTSQWNVNRVSGIAPTFANATFMAHAPRDKAMAHFEWFAQLMMRFRRDVSFFRTVARASFRAPDPIRAAEGFIADYDAVVAQLTSEGVEPSVARSLAGIASARNRLLLPVGSLRTSRRCSPWPRRLTLGWLAASLSVHAVRATHWRRRACT